MTKKMLIDATHAEETRVVVINGQRVEEFDFESENKRQLAGNIYLAKVTRVEPSLQACFVDYGGNRHGFLAFSEIHPDYYQIPAEDRKKLLEEDAADAKDDDAENGGKPKRSRKSKSARSDEGRTRSRKKKSSDSEGEANASEDSAQEPAAAEQVESEVTPVADTPVQTPDATVDAPSDAAPTEPHSDQAPDGTAPADVPTPPKSMAAEHKTDAVISTDIAKSEDFAESEEPSPEPAAQITGMETIDLETDSTSEGIVADPFGGSEQSESPLNDSGQDETVEEPKAAKPRRAKRTNSKSKAKRAESEATDEPDTPAAQDGIEDVGRDDSDEIQKIRKPKTRRYKIQEVIKTRQIMLVQVAKEERGNKGAALTTYLSLAGRYCVLMPNTARGGGISRKITNANDRKKLKEIANSLEVPSGAGLIIRTAGSQRNKAEIKRDYDYLQRLWEQIRELTLKSMAPARIYEEGDLIKRSIRDLYSREIDEVLVEGEAGYRTAKDFMKMIMPSHARNVKQYADRLPLFARYQVESTLAAMFNPVVQLKSGGYIVIGITEALVAIDVNSGRATKEGSIEDTALKTNLEAADEVTRQLRLRDLAGLIVIDFIDMEERRNNIAVEERMKERLQTDRARIQLGRISGFGLLEMSRQRLRPGMLEASTQPCPHCHGTGLIRSDESTSLSILRQLEEESVRGRVGELVVAAPVKIANFLLNYKREHIKTIEERYGIAVRVEADTAMMSPDFTVEKLKEASRTVTKVEPVVTVSSHYEEPEEEVPVLDEETPQEARDTDRSEDDDKSKKKRRRRGGRRNRGKKDRTEADAATDTPAENEQREAEPDTHTPATETPADPVLEAIEAAARAIGVEPTAEKIADEPIETESLAIAEPQNTAEPTETIAEALPMTAEPSVISETVTSEEETTPAPEPEEPTIAAEPNLETVTAADAAQPTAEEPQEPPKPRRRGWWGRRSS